MITKDQPLESFPAKDRSVLCTGIDELDYACGGGLPRGALTSAASNDLPALLALAGFVARRVFDADGKALVVLPRSTPVVAEAAPTLGSFPGLAVSVEPATIMPMLDELLKTGLDVAVFLTPIPWDGAPDATAWGKLMRRMLDSSTALVALHDETSAITPSAAHAEIRSWTRLRLNIEAVREPKGLLTRWVVNAVLRGIAPWRCQMSVPAVWTVQRK